MAVAGQSATISIFSVDTWNLLKIFTLHDACHGVKHIEFIPQLFDGGANQVNVCSRIIAVKYQFKY